MKIIEAMKRVKANHQKITDLQDKIAKNCAHLSYETTQYANPAMQIQEWLQSCEDTAKENTNLLVRIAKTNLATTVQIKLGDVVVTKNIAEWIWRRREYAKIDFTTWDKLTNRNLREGVIPSSTGGEALQAKIVYNFDAKIRDTKKAIYQSEPHEIDAALEVANAVTDLLE